MRVFNIQNPIFGSGVRMLERCTLNLKTRDPEHV